MNLREAREAYGLEPYTYSEEFLRATREYENSMRNLERALERLAGNGKTQRRRRTKRAEPSAPVNTESPEVV